MGLEIPSYSTAERLIYGPPAKTTLYNVSETASGEALKVGAYKRHSYQVSGSAGAVGFSTFNVYASNIPGQAKKDYQIVAMYTVNHSGLMYSDEWVFDSAYAAIVPYTNGSFTVIEKHSP
tara:strand:+ start:325 stop:684 length:360 start_codon:yes stop_codon:yes gene_type:complete